MTIGEFKDCADTDTVESAVRSTSLEDIADSTLRNLVANAQRALEDLDAFLEEHE